MNGIAHWHRYLLLVRFIKIYTFYTKPRLNFVPFKNDWLIVKFGNAFNPSSSPQHR